MFDKKRPTSTAEITKTIESPLLSNRRFALEFASKIEKTKNGNWVIGSNGTGWKLVNEMRKSNTAIVSSGLRYRKERNRLVEFD